MNKEDEKLSADLEYLHKELLSAAIGFRNQDPGLSAFLWKCSEIADRAKKRMTPVKRDWEGGGGSWFAVCEECRGQVGQSDLYCRHCGRPLKEDEG